MKGFKGRQALRQLALVFGVCLLTAFLAACGGGSDSSSSADSSASTEASGSTEKAGGAEGVALAEERVQEALAPIKFEPPGPEFAMSENKGKTVYFIATTMAIPYVATLAEYVKEAGEAAGVNVVIYDGKASVAEQDKGIQTAIAQKADGIILQAVDPTLVANSVKAAADAGISVIDANNGQPDDPNAPGVFGHVTPSTEEEGRLQIDFAVSQDGDAMSGAMINAPFFTVYKQRVPAMEEELEEVCPSCEFNIIDTDPTKPTTVPQAVSAGLKRLPNTNWVFPAFDSAMPLVSEGIKLNGATETIKIVGSDNTPEQLAELSDPNSPFEADVGNNVGWQGWAEIDLIGRAMAGEEPTSYELPLRMFTKDSLPSDPEGNWTGVDYPAEYKKIWGV